MRTLYALPLALLQWLATAPTVYGASTVNVTIPANAPASVAGNVVDDNFLGISIEFAALGAIWGNTTNSVPNAMLNYLSNLNQRITAPIRVRIGGNAMDASTYIPSYTKNLLDVTNRDNKEVIRTNFGPVIFDILNAVANRVGDMSFIIGLSMQKAPEDAEDVFALAAQAKRALGPRLDALLLGNEPDLYDGHDIRPGYTLDQYIDELHEFVADLPDRSEGTGLDASILGGPTSCCAWSLEQIINAGMQDLGYKYYTTQHYPKTICFGENDGNTNITYYATHSNIRDYINWGNGVALARDQGIPFIVSEFNTVSCGGSKISDTAAAGLWLLDATLAFASRNMTGAFMHTRESGVQYNMFDPPTDPRADPASPEGMWITRAAYYAMLAGSEIFRGGGAVSDLDLEGGTVKDTATSAGYALYAGEGLKPARLVLLNYADEGGRERTFRIPKGYGRLGVRILSTTDGAGLWASGTQMSWAGQRVGNGGVLQGDIQTDRIECKNGCDVPVPGPGAALVVLDVDGAGKDNLYNGNSTIAQAVGELGGGDPPGLNSAGNRWLSRSSVMWAVVSSLLACSLA